MERFTVMVAGDDITANDIIESIWQTTELSKNEIIVIPE